VTPQQERELLKELRKIRESLNAIAISLNTIASNKADADFETVDDLPWVDAEE